MRKKTHVFSRLHRILLMSMLLAAAVSALCETRDDTLSEAAVTGSAEWFRDAKFGMFIHWGISSHAGGIWDGKRYYGITEWLMRRGKIPSAEYKTLANEFNPVDFDAAEWIAVAKRAGVRYIVITAKHHDGFAMFGSEASDFNIVDATPYGKDPLKVLTREAHKAGIKIGFYYSQYQDWTEKDAGGNDWDFDEEKKDFDRYLKSKAMPQLEELLTNYGPIDIIWFDTPGDLSKEDAIKLKAWVKKLQPNCLVSDRIGHNLGDYKGYGDGEIPAVAESDRPWEAIFTHNDSWGYSFFDHNFKSTAEVLELLITTASKGGNLMLNIGPDGGGRIPAESVRTFEAIGEWLSVNGESIYGTSASPLGAMPWGVMTARPGKLYLHVLERPVDGRLIVPNFVGRLTDARLLANGLELEARQEQSDLFITLPEELPDKRVNVVVLEYQGEQAVAASPETILSNRYGPVRLAVEDLDEGSDAGVKKYSTMHYFGDWKHYFTVAGLNTVEKKAVWKLRVLEPGMYKIILNYSASHEQAGQEGVLSLAGEDYYFKVLETGEFTDPGGFNLRKPLMFLDHPVAVVYFEKPGHYELTLRPVSVNSELMKLRYLEIRPHD